MDLSIVLDAIRALGVAGGPVFALFYWQERKERLAAQAEYKALLPQVLTVASQAANSVSEVTTAVNELGSESREAVSTLTQLSQQVSSLASLLRKRVG